MIERKQMAFPSGYSDGMDLRDYFAALAMQASLQNDPEDFIDKTTHAEWAYDIADAMMEAREI